MKKKVMIGMSGGVDSSVAALILKKKGYDVTGVTMKLYSDEYTKENKLGGCCSINDIDDARKVCYKLGIEHIVINFKDVFESEVISYFVNEYCEGRTPNPCIACNTHVKFDAMLKFALSLNYDYISTGHYSIIEYNKNINRWLLKKSPSSKDQSYALYHLTQNKLSRILMPLSGLEKNYVRNIAKNYNLPVAQKPDSQEICFIKNNNYSEFIETYTGKTFKKGNFIDTQGNIFGKHNGITKYTIGQRKGLGLSIGKPLFVTKINAKENTITLGENGDQYSNCLIAKNLNFIPFDKLTNSLKVKTKIRYQAKPANSIITPLSENEIKVIFDEPQRSITPGQAVVFYSGNVVVGGGTIK